MFGWSCRSTRNQKLLEHCNSVAKQVVASKIVGHAAPGLYVPGTLVFLFPGGDARGGGGGGGVSN